MRAAIFSGAVFLTMIVTVPACTTGEGDDATLGASAANTGRCATTTATTSANVKVMTVNVRNDDDQWQRRFELIADEIARLDPDIIGTQEVIVGSNQHEYLNDLLAKRGHAKYEIYQRRKPGFGSAFTGEGLAVMSRWPIVTRDYEEMSHDRLSLLARVKHPSGGSIDVVDTHLHNGDGTSGEADRDGQAKETIDLAARNDACNPTVLTGDMNTTEKAPAIKRYIDSGFADSYRTVHGDATLTTGATGMIKLAEGPAPQTPKYRYDYVFGRSSGARTVTAIDSVVCFKNYDAKGFYPSDHLGVMTTFEMRF